MSGLLVITAKGEGAGFKCAGFDTVEANEKDDMARTLLDVQEQGRYGLVIVEERLLNKVPDNVIRRLRKRGTPIIMHINIPGKWEEKEFGESPVVRLIRKAIGYQIKIKR